MGAGEYESYAGTMADTLQGILAKRKAAERQAMLDQLSKANIMSEISSRDENTRSNAQLREARAQELMEQSNQKKLGTFSPGPIKDPKSAEWLGQNFPQTVQTVPGTEPLKPEDEGPTLPPSTNFLGTPQYQEQQRQEEALKALGNNPEFSKMDPLHQWLLMRASLPKGEAPPPPTMWSNEQSEPLQVFDESSGKFSPAMSGDKPIMGKKGERPVIRSRPPQGPAPSFMSIPDPAHPGQYLPGQMGRDGVVHPVNVAPNFFDNMGPPPPPPLNTSRTPTVKGQNIPLGVEEPPAPPSTQPAGVFKGNPPRAGVNPAEKPIIPPAIASSLATLRGKSQSGGLFGGAAIDQNKYSAMQDEAIALAPVSQDVRDTVADIVRNNDPETTDQIIQRHSGVFQGKDLADFAKLLIAVRGQ